MAIQSDSGPLALMFLTGRTAGGGTQQEVVSPNPQCEVRFLFGKKQTGEAVFDVIWIRAEAKGKALSTRR